jgi:outer membrane protein OmpA-like peptidoglycan-associated protein
MLFGSQQSGLSDKISQTSGLRLDSATKLLGFAAPFVMSWLGKRITQDNLTSKEFTQLVQREGATASSLLPAGISTYLTTPVTTTASRTVSSMPPPPAQTTSRWLWPLMALAALLLLWGWAAMRKPAGETISQVAERVGEPAKVVVTRVTTTLADGTSLSIPSVGLESELLNYLRNPPATVDPNRWFEFDRLYFDTNQATLRSDSQEQLRNIAAILKAHPNAKIKIGAYTDNTGESAANMTLSQHRAESVRAQLVGMGIPAERIEAEGYGEQHPVADNSTEAGRARNRRVALRLTAL